MTKLVSPSFPIGLPPLRSESQARLGVLPKTVISSSADYRRDDYVFPREQSRVMKDCEWEGRCARPEPWYRIIGAALGYVGFGYAALFKLLPFLAAVVRAL